MLSRLLSHPLTRGLDLDSPETTALRLRIVRGKVFLNRLYRDWYTQIAAALPPGDQPVLELGSGAGFLHEFVPRLVTSDVFAVPGLRCVLDAHRMPFADASLRGIAMTNVLHHLAHVEEFFADAARCVAPGGVMVMIEPWRSWWSQWVYTHLHHEPFDPAAPDWAFPQTGPLSGANGALPWIVFERDRRRFEAMYPQWHIRCVHPFMPTRYLLSGGVSMRSLLPGFAYPLSCAVDETLLHPLRDRLALFARIELVRS